MSPRRRDPDEPEPVTKSFRFPPDLLEWLDERARADDRSLNSMIVRLLQQARDIETSRQRRK